MGFFRQSTSTAAFLTPLNIPLYRQSHYSTRYNNFRSRTIYSPSKTRRATIVSAVGWEETRKNLSTLKLDESAPLEEERLPGVHFIEPPSITIEDLWNIVFQKTPDPWVNEIVRCFLGWRQMEDGTWNNNNVPEVWKSLYPDDPPDFIGKEGQYSPEFDQPIKMANRRLTRTIQQEYKQIFRTVMRPLGFKGWKVAELTPNRTRRAVVVNWILYWYKRHYPHIEFTTEKVLTR